MNEENIIYLSGGKMYLFTDNASVELPSETLAIYRRNAREQVKRSEWKNSGAGAAFTGSLSSATPEDAVAAIRAAITDVCIGEDGCLQYIMTVDSTSGVYTYATAYGGRDGITVSDNEYGYREFDSLDGRLAISALCGGGEKHIGIIAPGERGCRFLTEGESVDENPFWSRIRTDTVYFNSSGLAVTGQTESESVPPARPAVIMQESATSAARPRGPSALCAVNVRHMEITELEADAAFDFIKPKEGSDGALYFIRRPYETPGGTAPGILDILAAPFRFIGAIFGWMNLFTMRYSGKTLTNTAGARSKERDERRVIIDGNIINATRAQRENAAAGEKDPGIVPRSYELCRRLSDGSAEVLRKGVIDFTPPDREGVMLFSDGSRVQRLFPDGRTEVVFRADCATRLTLAGGYCPPTPD